MSRPVKFRRVEFFPRYTCFVPLGKPKCEMSETGLKLEELEAMRLKDIEDLSQEQCARKMQVSRQTFQNIIDTARKKVAFALMEGNSIRISGGNYRPVFCKFRCFDCGSIYEIKKEKDRQTCPNCGSARVVCNKKAGLCGKWCKLEKNI